MGRLADKQNDELLRILNKGGPQARMNHIQQQVNTLAEDTAPLLKQLGLEIDTNFPQINARIIESPMIAYAGGAQARFFSYL